MTRDVLLAVRWLRRSPGFAATAILSIAFGVGANAAVFTVVSALLLRPLPVADPDRLVRLTPGPERQTWSNPLWEEIRNRQTLFAGSAAWSPREFDLSDGGSTQFVQGLWVSGGFFDVLGVRPVRGRLLNPDDDLKGGGPSGLVAVISHGFWQRQFGGADVVGRRLSLDRVAFTIVGVTPPEFFGPTTGRSFDVALPIGTLSRIVGRDRLTERTWWWLSVIARLKPNQTIDQARQALAAEQPALREATRPTNLRAEDAARYLAAPLDVTSASFGTAPARQTYGQPMVVLMAIVGVVLVIACANVATLAIVKSDQRAHDVRVRVALGASRARLVRQSAIESALISFAGAGTGLLIAWSATGVLARQLSASVNPLVLDLVVDWRVIGFLVVIAALTAFGIGLVPALRAARSDRSLATGTRGSSLDKRQQWTLSALLTVQVTVSVALVAAAGLFVQTFVALTSRDPGFDADRIIVAHLDAQRVNRPPQNRVALFDELSSAARRMPGVEAAALSAFAPVSNNEWDTVVQNPSGSALTEDERRVYQSLVGPDWFTVYGIAIKAGRAFAATDLRPDSDVAIVNETLARRFFDGRSPLGQTIQEVGSPGDPSRPLTIVGVAADSLYFSLREVTPPTFYRPVTPAPRLTLSVRASETAAGSLIPGIARELSAVDRNVSFTIRPLVSEAGLSTTRERLLAWLAGLFGAVATVMAAVGLYGITAQAVAARRREIGIRLALGAGGRAITGIVMTRVLVAIGVGAIGGIALSVWAGRFVATLLYGVAPHEPATIGMALATLVVAAIVAAWVPTRRALSVEPSEVLRR